MSVRRNGEEITTADVHRPPSPPAEVVAVRVHRRGEEPLVLSTTRRTTKGSTMTTTTGMSVQGPATTCTPRDVTLPPVPRIETSIAFDHSTARARLVNDTPVGGGRAVPDPVYIELSNVEGGTTFELCNLSRNPEASFNDPTCVVQLDPTGRDLANRRASIYLTADQMQKLDLQPGDIYLLRAKDKDGNVSSHVRGELEPDDWANAHVGDTENDAWVIRRGARFIMLDGESDRKNIIARIVNDGRAPVVLEKNLRIETRAFCADEVKLASDYKAVAPELKQILGREHVSRGEIDALAGDARFSPAAQCVLERLAKDKDLFDKIDDAAWGNGRDGIVGIPDVDAIVAAPIRVFLQLPKVMEPGATMAVQNQRTGERFSGTINEDGQLTIPLNNMAAGDPLILSPIDHEGHAGKEMRLTYAPSCADGKAPVISALQGRLGGVIPAAT